MAVLVEVRALSLCLCVVTGAGRACSKEYIVIEVPMYVYVWAMLMLMATWDGGGCAYDSPLERPLLGGGCGETDWPLTAGSAHDCPRDRPHVGGCGELGWPASADSAHDRPPDRPLASSCDRGRGGVDCPLQASSVQDRLPVRLVGSGGEVACPFLAGGAQNRPPGRPPASGSGEVECPLLWHCSGFVVPIVLSLVVVVKSIARFRLVVAVLMIVFPIVLALVVWVDLLPIARICLGRKNLREGIRRNCLGFQENLAEPLA